MFKAEFPTRAVLHLPCLLPFSAPSVPLPLHSSLRHLGLGVLSSFQSHTSLSSFRPSAQRSLLLRGFLSFGQALTISYSAKFSFVQKKSVDNSQKILRLKNIIFSSTPLTDSYIYFRQGIDKWKFIVLP